jgi:release factor glutamine methyltransferase
MKIATNRLSDLYEFYKNELSLIYDEGELYSIFELVCEKYLNYSKSQVTQHFEENINQSNLINIYNAGVELKKGTPIQYILKEAFFYDLIFNVSNAVLIPRPETEELVDLIIKSQITNNSPISILDIGTGSGCIPITLKKHLPQAKVFGIDISDEALEVAKSNATKNNVEVEFIKQDILSNLKSSLITHHLSLIVSNPPYVLNSEAQQMDARVLEHEPHLALFVEDNDPIIFYKRIIDLCSRHLEEKGWLFFELNPMYAIDVKNYANDSKIFNFTEILSDMSGKQRFLKAQKK